ncbi:MAG TPA: GntR family transcriptional regulator [Acetobacteraceae bacterium]|jgi:GntR family transcriptional regulator|nr:GntR family transcriptional regulator [Acetobacteraceae bacterium]
MAGQGPVLSNEDSEPVAAGSEIYLYRRIEAAVRAMIAEGRVAPGARLPPESTLAGQFRTTRVTVAKALAALERDGLVHRLVGRGTFVAETRPVTSIIDSTLILSFEEQVGSAGRAVSFRLLGFRRIVAPDFALERLRLAPGTKLYRMDRLRLIEGRVICLEERYIPIKFAERITQAMLASKGVVEIMGDLLGYPVPVFEVTLYPAIAGSRLARLMELAPGSPVTVREHVLRDRAHQPIVCGINTFTAEARISYVLGAAASDEPGASRGL